MSLSLGEATFTVADGYRYALLLVHCTHDYEGIPVDTAAIHAELIGWASRDQNELI